MPRQVPKQGNHATRQPRVKAGRWLLNDKLGLQRSPLPEIFTGLVGDPIARIGFRLKVTDVLGWGVWPTSLVVPRTVFALLWFQHRDVGVTDACARY